MFSNRTRWKLDENAYTRALRRHKESSEPLLDLTASNPTTCGFEYDAAAILGALSSAAALHYDPQPKGSLHARESVARYYEEKVPGARIDPEHLLLTTGTSEAYSFLFRLLCDPGDEVLIARPSYPLFDFLAAIQDVQLRPFQFVFDHGWQIDFQSLRAAIGPRTRAVLLVHPNNPTGNFVSVSEAKQLNALCEEQQLALVIDEVFLDYQLRAPSAQQKPHGSFVANRPTLTFVLSGLSKIAALPQMKLGWIAASGPQQLLDHALARLEVIADTYLSLNASVQHALPALLDQRRIMQPQLIARLRTNLQRLDRDLAAQKAVSRFEMEGGWYAVLRVPALQSDEELAIRLIEQYSVQVHPGHFYDFPGEGYLVVSLLTPSDDFNEGITRLIACIGS
jgi:alanine-synthesizing transaminase